MQAATPNTNQKQNGNDGSLRLASKASLGSVLVSLDEGDKKSLISERSRNGNQKLPTVDMGARVFPQMVSIGSTLLRLKGN